jgi:hypothetical protein
MPTREPSPYDLETIRDLSETVYRQALGSRGEASMLKTDNDGGVKLRSRSRSLDAMTRRYLDAVRDMGGDVSFALKSTDQLLTQNRHG